jgi:large subunit ribosomal protein L25
MSKTPELKAQKRTLTGRKVKKLRREGKVIANLFGPKIDSQALTLDHQDFTKIYEVVGETGVTNIVIEGQTKPHPVLIHQLHTDPKTDAILHVDLLQVDLTKKITANIPLEVVGESPAVDQGGVLVLAQNELEVEALPNDLPDKLEVDVTKLEKIGDSLLVKDLAVPGAVTVLADQESTIVTIQEPAPEEEPEPVEVEIETDTTSEAGESAVDTTEASDAKSAEDTSSKA